MASREAGRLEQLGRRERAEPADGGRVVRLSVLDRLDEEKQPRTGGRTPTWSDAVAALKRAVLEDLQLLLNTRRVGVPPTAARPELARSVYAYGLPDLTTVSRDSAEEQRHLARAVAETITLFEPRLSGVRVTVVEADAGAAGAGGTADAVRRDLRFLVEAMLRVEPVPEPIVFDARIEAASGEVEIGGAGDG